MKAFSLTRVLSVFLVSMLGISLAYAATVLPRPSVSGPTLGDPTINLDSMEQSLQNNTFSNYFSLTTLTVGAAATTSTVLNYGFTFVTSTGTGLTTTLLLPTAKPAANLVIANGLTSFIVMFGAGPASTGTSPFTVGLSDTINGLQTIPGAGGLSAYVLTAGFTANCFAPQGGNWWCTSSH